jgi:hypothetical protein
MTNIPEWLANHPVGVPPRPTANNCDEGTCPRRDLFGDPIEPTAALPEAEPPPLAIVPENQLWFDFPAPAPPGSCDTHTGQPPPGKSGKCLLGGSPWKVTPSTIPGKDGGPVHHPAARTT